MMLDLSGDYISSTIRARESAALKLFEAAIKWEQQRQLDEYWLAWLKLVAKDRRDWI
jgi:hypothetical protein